MFRNSLILRLVNRFYSDVIGFEAFHLFELFLLVHVLFDEF
jgi:hypothetical protein